MKNPNFQTIYSIGKNLEVQRRLFKNPYFHHFHELVKAWEYTQPNTNISKFKFLIYGR